MVYQFKLLSLRMKLIKEEKLAERKHKLSVMDMCGFDMGIEFAEEQLQDFIIRFAEWHWMNRQARTTSELLKIFTEQIYPNIN